MWKTKNGLTENYSEYFDYTGVDLYTGSFEPYTKFMWINEFYVKYLYYVTRKPIVITEFGYIGHGETKTKKEKQQYLLDTFGEKFDSEDKIKENFPEFLEIFNKKGKIEYAEVKIDEIINLIKISKASEQEKQNYLNSFYPYDSIEKMQEDKLGFYEFYVKKNNTDKTASIVLEAKRIMEAGNYSEDSIEEATDYFFTYGKEHLYKTCDSKIGVIGYEHTEEGQADFLRDFVRKLSKKNYVCGFFVYQLLETPGCYMCNQKDCPVETGWGLIRVKHGDPLNYLFEDTEIKPSYYAIKEVYEELKNNESK